MAMDAFDIALLMANQHADSPVRMRYGTVVGACDESVLSVVPDGQESPVPAVKCCLPGEGSRVHGSVLNSAYRVGDILTNGKVDSRGDRFLFPLIRTAPHQCNGFGVFPTIPVAKLVRPVSQDRGHL